MRMRTYNKTAVKIVHKNTKDLGGRKHLLHATLHDLHMS